MPRTAAAIAAHASAPILAAPHGAAPVDLLLERPDAALAPPAPAADHGALYRSWSTTGGAVEREALKALLAAPPPGLYRFKGRIRLAEGRAVEAQLVGRTWEIVAAETDETRAVAIGLADRFDPAAFETRWRAILR